jgi:hypothetical protein
MNSDPAQLDVQPYLVSLREADGLPAGLRIAAEARFATVLERSLGGPAQVAHAFRAWTSASECAAEELDKASVTAAMRWPRAADLARQAGLREVGELPGAHFEVKLPRQ